jgi:hypothetical protein
MRTQPDSQRRTGIHISLGKSKLVNGNMQMETIPQAVENRQLPAAGPQPF